MTFSIRVAAGPTHRPFFHRQFDLESEYQRVIGYCVDAKEVSQWKAQWTVVRTDTFINFCEDFFFPAACAAMKTQHLAERILEMIVSFFLDLITLPIRCITLIPRLIYNYAHQQENHPFYRYLIEEGVEESSLAKPQVHLERTERGHRTASTLSFIEIPPYLSMRNISFE